MTSPAPLATRRVFLAATGQNRGKTTASLGIIAGFSLAGHRLGFLKPVGQRYLVVDGTRADEDAILIREVCGLEDALNDMSPVTLPRHFTTDYILGRIDEDLGAQVKSAFERIAVGKDLVVIEGTGHAGVGAVVGLSNAAAAALLESKVIIVSEGGVGRPIDEIVLNASLANPSLELIVTHLDGELLSGVATPGKTIGQVVIGAMQAEHARAFFHDRTLVITPGDREDLIRAAIASGPERVMGLILTGGFRPAPEVLAELKAANLFAYLVPTDTLHTAQAANAILVKTHPTDVDKIATIISLVAGSIDIDALLARL